MRLSTDLSRVVLRREGRKVTEDFIRVEHVAHAALCSGGDARPTGGRSSGGGGGDDGAGTGAAGAPSLGFTIALRGRAPVELTAATAQERDDWIEVLNSLASHRSQLFFLKYNIAHMLPPAP